MNSNQENQPYVAVLMPNQNESFKYIPLSAPNKEVALSAIANKLIEGNLGDVVIVEILDLKDFEAITEAFNEAKSFIK